MIRQPFDFFVQWHLTERCNLKCTHCYQSGERTGELPLSVIRRVIGEVKAMIEAWEDAYGLSFSLSYNVTGGEPFLRPDLFDVLEDIGSGRGEVSLLSNGTLVTQETAQELAAHAVKGVQVSVEGPERVHDQIRGAGNFKKAMRGVQHLLGAGLSVTLNATLSRLNSSYLGEFVDIASDVGVQRLGFSRLVPAGRGGGLLRYMLGADEVRRLYETAFSIRSAGLEIVSGDPLASLIRSSETDDIGSTPLGGCAAGISGITLLSDGTITPCRRLGVPVGNVQSDSLREVWAASDVLNLLRDRKAYKGRCGQCRRWAVCRGCRAIAYACSASGGGGDFLSEDPQCFLVQGPGAGVQGPDRL